MNDPRAKSHNRQGQGGVPVGRVSDAGRQQALGQVKLQAQAWRKAEVELVRRIVRARARGCSLRDLADVSGYGSHHRISELLARHASAQDT